MSGKLRMLVRYVIEVTVVEGAGVFCDSRTYSPRIKALE
jgi:hypothetical protein